MELTVKVVIDPSEKLIELFSMLLGSARAPVQTVTTSQPIVQTNPGDMPAVGVKQKVKPTKETPASNTTVAAETIPTEGELSPSEQVMADNAANQETPAAVIKPEDVDHKPITAEELRLLATIKMGENKVVREPLVKAWLREHIPEPTEPKLPNLEKQFYPKFKAFLTYDLP